MFKRVYWWVVHRIIPRHRYHIVRTGLRPGFHDVDNMGNHPELEDQKAIENTVLKLYLWWTLHRPNTLVCIEILWSNSQYKEAMSKEDELFKMEQIKLNQLIAIRESLWR